MRSHLLRGFLLAVLAAVPSMAAAQQPPPAEPKRHQHQATGQRASEEAARRAAEQLLAEEKTRAVLMETILENEEFVRGLVARLVGDEAWRAIVEEQLALLGDGGSPAREDSVSRAAGVRKQPAVAASYRCPMHPEVTSSRPGSCSRCGMALKASPSKGAR